MLVEISCEQFRQEKIIFNAGLNVVRGTYGGSGAIGKSMFLKILDFVFGGSDYIKYARENVTPHLGYEQEFRFSFVFDETEYYFSRSTGEDGKILEYNRDFKKIKRNYDRTKYQEFLTLHYRVGLNDSIAFSTIGKYFLRVYGRHNSQESEPLRFGNESSASSIEFLMRLFDRYTSFQQLKDRLSQVDIAKIKRERERFRKENTLGKIAQIKKDIAEQRKRQDQITQEMEGAQFRTLGVDPSVYEQEISTQQALRMLIRQRRQLVAQLQAVEGNKDSCNETAVGDFSALQRYFPDANIQALDSIEQFHSKISVILNGEIAQEAKRLRLAVARIDAEIAERHRQLKVSGIVRTEMESYLTQYHETSNKLADLTAQLDELEQFEQKQAELAKQERAIAILRAKKASDIEYVERCINEAMDEKNGIITRGQRPSPLLRISFDQEKDSVSYRFETPGDTSERTSFKNLIVYDLAILALTTVPVLIHDSNITGRVEDDDFEEILRLYQQCGRQVFIAFDKQSTPRAEEMLEVARVLSLSEGKEALFGKYWAGANKVTSEEPTEEPIAETTNE